MRFHPLSAAGASAIAMIASAGLATPAFAQSADPAEVQAELQQMRSQMQAMAARIDTLESQLATAQAKADAATQTSTTALAAAEAAKSDTKVSWKGAPQFEGKNGFTFKPRGRIQFDAGYLGAPEGYVNDGTGFGTELRRAYLGFDGTLPGGFGYRAEINVADQSLEVTDLYLTHNLGKSVKLTLGQQKPFWGLEELTSDLFTTFTERAPINTAFGYERKVGLSAAMTSGDVIVQGGVFTDNISDLSNDGNHELTYSGRAVFAPKLGKAQLHLGANVNIREANQNVSTRYRVRPFIHTPDIRFIDTDVMTADGETGYGLEAALISGPFHAAGEAHWQSASRPGLVDPTFFGAYAEAGLFLTKGDSRGYKSGTFDRVKPANPLGSGGMGALQVNIRYDHLDLNDAGITGGKQDGYSLGLIWTPTDYTRFMLNYGRVEYTDAYIAMPGGDRSYGVDAVGARAQIDF